jgi:uncharacterized delta-60 repeat protein
LRAFRSAFPGSFSKNFQRRKRFRQHINPSTASQKREVFILNVCEKYRDQIRFDQNNPTMKKILSFYFILLAIGSIAQIPGSLDPSFNSNGKYVYDFGYQDNLQCVAIQPNDQKIVSAGTALSAGFAGRLVIVRHNPDGTLDPDFSGDGILMIEDYTESYAYACHIGTDGKITVAGTAADPTYLFSMLVLRFLEDGTPDPSFGVDGVARYEISPLDDFAYNMVIQEDGKIVLAGTAQDESYRNVPTIVRLLSDGSLDMDFGTDGVAQVEVAEADNKFNDVKIDSQGRIVACGHIGFPLTGTGQFNFDVMVARFLEDGNTDSSFDGDGKVVTPVSAEYVESALGLTVLNDDKILVAGYTTLLDFSFDALLIQYDVDGQTDNTFGVSGIQTYDHAIQDVFYDITTDANGKILPCGTSGGFFFDDRDFLLMRLLADGTPDPSFANAGMSLESILTSFDEANAIVVQADDRIVLAGKTNNGTNNDIGLARYMHTGTDNVKGETLEKVRLFPNPVCTGREIQLSGIEHADIESLAIINQLGMTVTEQIPSFNHWNYIQLPELSANSQYVLRIKLKNGAVIHQSFLVMNND